MQIVSFLLSLLAVSVYAGHSSFKETNKECRENYVVLPGETLTSIAMKLQLSPEILRKYNHDALMSGDEPLPQKLCVTMHESWNFNPNAPTNLYGVKNTVSDKEEMQFW